ncbi:competence type IV pilus minor pilin ComGD [Streptococcus timonensis]|uniref:competence type IV pilus minor pilin ComGD n=1 Tax=Streptococcus timonensis TaxID=1852387 RepID=UPI0039C390C3
MQNKIQIKQLRIKAFTMLESLLVLGMVSLLALGLSSSVQSTFEAVEEQIFFMEFEELYRETQKRSLASQKKLNLILEENSVRNDYQRLMLPKGILLESNKSITFDKSGGNSSLASVRFRTKKEVVRYQLYLGNGKIKRIQETNN